MKKLLKFCAVFAALTLTFGFAACSSSDDDDNNSGKSEPSTPIIKTYTEASDEEKALFTVTYNAEQLAALSHAEQTLTDAITITASVPWTIEEYSDGYYDTWALLSTQKSEATTETTTKITLDIEDNLAEFWAGVTYDENGNPDMSAAEMPEDRTTILHLLNAAGRQIAAITLTQTGNSLASGLVTDVVSSNHQFIGRGYDIFAGRWAHPADVKNSVIIDRKKMENRDQYIEFQKDARAEYTVRKGETLKELSNSFNVNADVSLNVNKDGSGKKDSGNTFLFTGELKASYGSDYKETGSEEYGIYSYNAQLGTYKIDTSEMIDNAVDVNPDGSFTNNYLSDGAYKAIYGINRAYQGDAGIRKLLQTYGTHVICSGVMGGRLDYSTRIQKSEINDDFAIEGYLKAGFKNEYKDMDEKAEEKADVKVDAEALAKYEQKMRENSTFYESKKKSIGGSTDLSLSESEWIKTLDADTAALMEFQTDSLRPIWDLCLDPERAAAIERVATSYAESFVPSFFEPIGAIVLKDGSVVQPSTYTADSSNPAVGVIAYLGTGGTLGRRDTVYMIGLEQRDKRLAWPRPGSTTISSILNQFFFSEYDGTENLKQFSDIIADDLEEFPGIKYILDYGKTNFEGTAYEDGWFLPARYELLAILNNANLLTKSLKIIAKADLLEPAWYGSSSIYYESPEWLSHGARLYSNGKLRDSSDGLDGPYDIMLYDCRLIPVFPIPIDDVYANLKY